MAKPNGLGKGLGALLGDAAIDTEAIISGKPAGGLKNNAAAVIRKGNIPDCIEVDDEGGLWVNPEFLKPNPKQPRVEFNQRQLEELADSIRENGILEPIIIEHVSGNEFYIIAGERRTRASKMLGLKKVPVQLRKFDDQQKLEMALIENIQRADLNPIEEATAYYNLVQMSDLTQDEVAKKVGKNRSTVANAIRLLKLPEDIQRSLVNGTISAGHARALLSVKNDSDMRVLFGKIVGSGLNVREAEAMAETFNNGGRASKEKKAKKTSRKDPDVAIFEQQLRNLFGIRGVTLDGTLDKGSLKIDYNSKEDFERICEVLKISE